MPRYYDDCPHVNYGYDLDEELPFVMINGEKCQLGSAGSIILACPTCGSERFRQRVSEHERCFDGHGRMEPLRFSQLSHYRKIWADNGDALTTKDERRAERLAAEKLGGRGGWVFGDKTEADFPLGYVHEWATVMKRA